MIEARKKELVEAVKAHALAHYEEKFGWSEIVECFSDEEIYEEFVAQRSFGDYHVPEAISMEDAVKRAADYVDLKEERYREAVGPDVPCGVCGTLFPENTACPHEGRADHALPPPECSICRRRHGLEVIHPCE